MKMDLHTIKVDTDFQKLLTPLDKETRAKLEEGLVAFGCLSPLVVWAGQNILLDGHNRREICLRRKIEADVVEIELPDRDAAADWIDLHQVSRRNLTPDQLSIIRGRRYIRLKRAEGRPKKRGQNVPVIPERTADKLAAEHGVTERTIRRDGKFAEAVETLAEVVPDLPKQIAEGKAPSRSAIIRAAKEPERAVAILAGNNGGKGQAEPDGASILRCIHKKKVSLELPKENPEAAAHTLLSIFDAEYLRRLITELEAGLEGA